MAVFPNAGFERFIVSVKRVSTSAIQWFNEGFSGYGWKLWERASGKHRIEVDEAFVRRNLVSFEQVFSHLRSAGGDIALTQGFGKIKSIVSDDSYYYITLEGDMLFQPNDFIYYRNDSNVYGRAYHAKVDFIQKLSGEYTIYIPVSELADQNAPEIGDSLVQLGNSTQVDRQGAIILHLVQGTPMVDVYMGIDSTDDVDAKLVHRFAAEGFIGTDRLTWEWNSGTQKFDINANFKTLNVDDSFVVGGNTIVGGNLTVGGALITP